MAEDNILQPFTPARPFDPPLAWDDQNAPAGIPQAYLNRFGTNLQVADPRALEVGRQHVDTIRDLIGLTPAEEKNFKPAVASKLWPNNEEVPLPFLSPEQSRQVRAKFGSMNPITQALVAGITTPGLVIAHLAHSMMVEGPETMRQFGVGEIDPNSPEATRAVLPLGFLGLDNIAAVRSFNPVVGSGQKLLGRTPTERDISDAARVVRGEVGGAVSDKSLEGEVMSPGETDFKKAVIDLWEDHGVHPAEAAEHPAAVVRFAEATSAPTLDNVQNAMTSVVSKRGFRADNTKNPLVSVSQLSAKMGIDQDSLYKLLLDAPKDETGDVVLGNGQVLHPHGEVRGQPHFSIRNALPPVEADTLADVAKTGNPRTDAVLDDPGVRDAINRGTVDTQREIAYAAGASNQPGLTHVDDHFQAGVKADGRQIDVTAGLHVHEQVEKHVIDILTQGGMPDADAYLVSHNLHALPSEHAIYKALGHDPAAVETAMKQNIRQIGEEQLRHPAADLYQKPYPHDDQAAAAEAPEKPLKPTSSMIGMAEAILDSWRQDVDRNGVSREIANARPGTLPNMAAGDGHDAGLPSPFGPNVVASAPFMPLSGMSPPGYHGGGPSRVPPTGGGAPPIPPGSPPGSPATRPSPRQPRAPYWTYQEVDRPLVMKMAYKVKDVYVALIDPAAMSEAAKEAEPLFAVRNAQNQSMQDAIIRLNADARKYWNDKSAADNIHFIQTLQLGATGILDPTEAQHAADIRTLFDWADRMEHSRGSKYEYVQNYFPQIWENPDIAQTWINRTYPEAQVGSKWFQKKKYYDFVMDGIAAGLRLKGHPNPNVIDLAIHRMLASADMVSMMDLLDNLGDMGLAMPASDDPRVLLKTWQSVKAPTGSPWLIAPDIQPLWRNAVTNKGLRTIPWIGGAFEGWMAYKATWVPIKLAASGFHPIHLAEIAMADSFAAGADAINQGASIAEAFKLSLDSLAGIASNVEPKSWRVKHTEQTLGQEAIEAFTTIDYRRTQRQHELAWVMTEGGFVPGMPEKHRLEAFKQLERAMKSNYGFWAAIPRAAQQGIQLLNAPLFQFWIPRLKTQAYVTQAAAILSRRPELLGDSVARRLILNTLRKQIEDRVGDINYANMFMDPVLKDLLKSAFLSFGWTRGFVRQFLTQPAMQAYRTARAIGGVETEADRNIRVTSNASTFAASYLLLGAVVHGTINYMWTGEAPHGMDYFMPRTGDYNSDGSPRRFGSQNYIREFAMALGHIRKQGGDFTAGITTMMWDKMTFQPLEHLWNNRDYYGTDIWSHADPVWRQAADYVAFELKDQYSPMSVTNVRRVMEDTGSYGQAAMAVAGFGPAPRYVDRGPEEALISYYYQRYRAAESHTPSEVAKTRELSLVRNQALRAQHVNDQQKLDELQPQWIQKGGTKAAWSNIVNGVGTDIRMFGSLPTEAQDDVMNHADKAHFDRYYSRWKGNLTHKLATAVNTYLTASEQKQSAEIMTKLQAQIIQLVRSGLENGEIGDTPEDHQALFRRLVPILHRPIAQIAPVIGLSQPPPRSHRATGLPRTPPSARPPARSPGD